MAKVTIPANCGNSPKMLFLKDFNIAFAESDLEFITSNVTDDIRWNLAGDKLLQGIDGVAEALEAMSKDKVLELIIHDILTHGRAGAANGTLELISGKSYTFCDMYRFSSNAKNAKIKEITSYIIELTD